MLAVPFENTGVNVVVSLEVIVAERLENEVIVGAGTTVLGTLVGAGTTVLGTLVGVGVELEPLPPPPHAVRQIDTKKIRAARIRRPYDKIGEPIDYSILRPQAGLVYREQSMLERSVSDAHAAKTLYVKVKSSR
jgi:hypothetical protein